MQQNKSIRLSWIFLCFSFLLNLILAYFLIDDSFTNSFMEADLKRTIRQKNEVNAFLNLALKNDDFVALKNIYLSKNRHLLFKNNEDGCTIIGEICFKKTNGYYSAFFVDDEFNK